MGRPMMHRKVQHNRKREHGAPDHLAAGLPHLPASTVAEFLPLEGPSSAGAPAPELRRPAPVLTGAQVQREALKATLRELLDELLEERFRGPHTELQGNDEQAQTTPTAP